MNKKSFLLTSVLMSALIAGCSDEEITETYTPEPTEQGSEPEQDKRLLEPVMLDYLYQIQGTKTVVGVHNREPNSDPDRWTQEIAKTTGVWPGLWSGDFLFSQDDVDNRWTMIYEAEKRFKQGMLVNLMLHVCPPTTEEVCGWNEEGMHYEMTSEEWESLLTEGGELNQIWKARLDGYAEYLDYLNKEGVRVFFRPFHEMNQNIFWWSSKTDGEEHFTPELYRMTHDYLVNEKSLTNLTFVWNLQDFATLEEDLTTYDPGESYWDILSLDYYGTDGTGLTQEKYNALVNKANGKPIALGEVQTLPTAALLEEQPLWTFVMSWAELTFQHNTKGAIRNLYLADNVVKLDEMPGWTEGNKAVYEVPVSGEEPVEPLVIFEDELGEWRLPDSNSAISESVVEDDETYGNVIEHTYSGNETVSEFKGSSKTDLSAYRGGTLSFDLKVVAEPEGIDGNWFMKIDCGWPCGTGDVAIDSGTMGSKPVVGEWQHYEFLVDELAALPNGGTPLILSAVDSPLVIFPQWGSNQAGSVFRIDNIKYTQGEQQPVVDRVIFDEATTEWKLPEKSDGLITEEVVAAEDESYGNVLQHTYESVEVVSELASAVPMDFSDYANGTLSFDLLIVNEPEGIDGKWFMKIDCGWPCGTGDVPLNESLEGTAPTVGIWQRYTFSIDALTSRPNDGNSLQLDSVTSPLVLFPAYGPNQKGTVFQLDNVIYSPQ